MFTDNNNDSSIMFNINNDILKVQDEIEMLKNLLYTDQLLDQNDVSFDSANQSL